MDCAAAPGEDDCDEPTVERPDGKAPGLTIGVLGFDRHKAAVEEFDRIKEVDAVLSGDREALGVIPLELGRNVATYVATSQRSRPW